MENLHDASASTSALLENPIAVIVEPEAQEATGSYLKNITCHNADQIPTIEETIAKNPESEREIQLSISRTAAVVKKQIELSTLFKRLPEYLEKYPISPPVRPDMYEGSCGFQAARIFLSQAGYLSTENRDRIVPIPSSALIAPKSGPHVTFFDQLEDLDNTPE